MNRKILSKVFLSLSVLFLFTIISCKKQPIEREPAPPRMRQERSITITNQTGNPISAYQVNVGSSGVEIAKGTPSNDSFNIPISNDFNNDPSFEVVLIDIYERKFSRTVDVPLEGNTDITITADYRVSEGWFTDKRKDLVAWFNRNK